MKYKKLLAQSLFWRISGFVTSFVLTLLIARIFGPALSAGLNLFVAGSALIILIANLNLDSSIVYFVAGDRLPLVPLINLVIVYCLLAMTGVLVLAFSINWSDLQPYFDNYLAIAVFVYLAGLQVSNFSTAFFYGRQNFTVPGVVISLFNCLQIICLIFLNRDSESSDRLHNFLPVFFAAPFLQGFCLAIYFRIKYVGTYSMAFLKTDDVKKVFRLASVFFLTNLLLFLMYRVDYWMLKRFDPSTDKLDLLGNYIQASKLGQAYLLFSSAIGSAIFAGISATRHQEPIGSLCRTIRVLLTMGLISYLILLVIGKPVIYFFYGNSFDHVYGCCLLIVPGIVSVMSASVTANYLSGKGWVKYNLTGVAFGLIIIVAGNYFLIPYWSIYASALVSSVGYIFYSAYMLIIFKNKTGCSWKELFVLKREDISFVKSLFITTTPKKAAT